MTSVVTREPGAVDGRASGRIGDAPPVPPPGRLGRIRELVKKLIRGPERNADRRTPATTAVTSGAMALLGLLLVAFGAELTVVGAVRHSRAQATGYDELRADLANAVTPVGPMDGSGDLVPLGKPVALLDIPSLGLREVVREGTTSGVLMSGPGHRRDTALPGQDGVSILYGRASAYGGPFRRLHDLVPGAPIVVVTGQGKQTFTVVGQRRAGDPTPLVASGQSLLTLTTADGPALAPTGLLRVDAKLDSPVQARPAAAFLPGRVPHPELAMEGDPSALLPLVLWTELLLLAAGGLAWARVRWGGWQTWVVGLPTLLFICIAVSDHVAALLPNLL
jgi:sortase A